MFAIDNKASL